MADYATIAEVKGFARQGEALDDASWQTLVTGASRLFDNLCEVEPDFFAGGRNPQIFIGADLPDLPINDLITPPMVGSVTIESNAYPIPPYEIVLGFPTSLRTMDGSLWALGIRVFIDADWAPAFAYVPADVNYAVIEMCIHFWRKSDPSFASISQAENSILLAKLPPTAQATVDKYRATYSNRCLFA